MKGRKKGEHKWKRGCNACKPISQKGQGRVQIKNEAYTIFTSGNVSELPSDGINR